MIFGEPAVNPFRCSNHSGIPSRKYYVITLNSRDPRLKRFSACSRRIPCHIVPGDVGYQAKSPVSNPQTAAHCLDFRKEMALGALRNMFHISAVRHRELRGRRRHLEQVLNPNIWTTMESGPRRWLDACIITKQAAATQPEQGADLSYQRLPSTCALYSGRPLVSPFQ